MVPYTSFLLQVFDAYLKTLAVSSDESSTLWTSLVTTLAKTLSYDDGGTYIKPCLYQLILTVIV